MELKSLEVFFIWVVQSWHWFRFSSVIKNFYKRFLVLFMRTVMGPGKNYFRSKIFPYIFLIKPWLKKKFLSSNFLLIFRKFLAVKVEINTGISPYNFYIVLFLHFLIIWLKHPSFLGFFSPNNRENCDIKNLPLCFNA